MNKKNLIKPDKAILFIWEKRQQSNKTRNNSSKAISDGEMQDA